MSRFGHKPLRGSVTQNFAASRRLQPEPVRKFIVRSGLSIIVLGLLLGLGTWLWHIGWPQKKASEAVDYSVRLTKDANFKVADVIVEGRKQTDRADLTAALNIALGAPILTFDPEAALKRVEHLPWVGKAVIERRLPDTIYVRLTEREPTARWQHDGKIVVIDRDGNELPNAKLENFAPLPLVVGEDAPRETAALLDALKTYPSIARLMQSSVRVSERRWNLYLQPKVLVKLPEHNVANALERLERLIREQKVLERGIVGVDLRLADRMFLESGNPPAKGTEQKP